jgi:hypothetical protein
MIFATVSIGVLCSWRKKMSNFPLTECDDAVIRSFLKFADVCPGALCHIEKRGSTFYYKTVSRSELDEWTSRQGGGFGMYALNIEEWDSHDKQRAYGFLGKGNSLFYIRVTSEYIQVFPSSI